MCAPRGVGSWRQNAHFRWAWARLHTCPHKHILGVPCAQVHGVQHIGETKSRHVWSLFLRSPERLSCWLASPRKARFTVGLGARGYLPLDKQVDMQVGRWLGVQTIDMSQYQIKIVAITTGPNQPAGTRVLCVPLSIFPMLWPTRYRWSSVSVQRRKIVPSCRWPFLLPLLLSLLSFVSNPLWRRCGYTNDVHFTGYAPIVPSPIAHRRSGLSSISAPTRAGCSFRHASRSRTLMRDEGAVLIRGPRLGRIGRNCPPPRGGGDPFTHPERGSLETGPTGASRVACRSSI